MSEPPKPDAAAPAPKKDAAPAAESAPAATAAPPVHAPLLRSFIHFAALAFAFPCTWLAAHEDIAYGYAWASGICVALTLLNLFALDRIARALFGRTIRRAEPETQAPPAEDDAKTGADDATASVSKEAAASEKSEEAGKSDAPSLDEPAAAQAAAASGNQGIWQYPLALAGAFLIFAPFAVGAAWAVLAAGDAAAATVGRRFPRFTLPWHPRKTWAGILAFIVCATPAAALMMWWTPHAFFLAPDDAIRWPVVWTIAFLAAAAGAVMESLEGPFDDNPRVIFTVAPVALLAGWFLHFGTAHMPPARALEPQWLLHALAVNAGLVAVVWVLRFADFAGALAGGVIGTLVFFFALPQGYALLILFVVGGSLLSRVGQAKKVERRAAEARGGTRGVSNVAANLTVPALCCLLYPASGGHPAALLAFSCSLAAALADTASSEIGALAGGKPRLITSFEEVDHGTDGAITFAGYLAAAGSCLLFGVVAWVAGFWHVMDAGHDGFSMHVDPARGILFCLIVILAGLFGTTVDSILGARFEGKVRGVGKGAVNFACTLCGAFLGVAVGWYLW